MWIDAHCHFADERLKSTINDEIRVAENNKISHWIQGGVGPEDWKRQDLLSKQFPNKITKCFGLHPWWVSDRSEKEIESAFGTLEENISSAPLLGELGLDGSKRFQNTSILEKQTRWFIRQLELANHIAKPIVLHIVRLHDEAIAILKKSPPKSGGMVHSFSGNWTAAEKYLSLGLLISVSGSIFRNEKGSEVLSNVPSDSLVIETDSPDQRPSISGLEPGDLNSPSNLIPIAQEVAKLRNTDWRELLTQSAKNLKKMGIRL